MKAIALRTIFLIAGLIISLSIAELVLKISNYPSNALPPDYMPGSSQPDATIGWKHRPGTYFYANPEKSNQPFRFTILEDGSRAVGAKSEASNHPIVLLGCSFVAGFGLDDRETFAWRLQELLPKEAIVNLGVGAYGTLHSLIKLKQYLNDHKDNGKPKLIVYGFADFHIFRNIKNPGMQRYWKSKGTFPYCDSRSCKVWEGKSMAGWPRHSRIFSMIENLIDLKEVSTSRQMAESVTMKLILEMQELAVKNNVKLILVPVSLEDRSWIDKFDLQNISNLECDSSLLHSKEYRLPDGHPNELWSEKFAECLKLKIEPFLGN